MSRPYANAMLEENSPNCSLGKANQNGELQQQILAIPSWRDTPNVFNVNNILRVLTCKSGGVCWLVNNSGLEIHGCPIALGK
jgi:hypothetical protein